MFDQEHMITSELVRVEAPGLASRQLLISDGSLLHLEELATIFSRCGAGC
jgi:hypothetical protein